jgi:hypothetical protein
MEYLAFKRSKSGLPVYGQNIIHRLFKKAKNSDRLQKVVQIIVERWWGIGTVNIRMKFIGIGFD